MKNKRRAQPPDGRISAPMRRELTMLITCDDMAARLKTLAQEGRRDDCLALMQELGEWQSRSAKAKTSVLWIPLVTQTPEEGA
jgi:hypothetical protein